MVTGSLLIVIFVASLLSLFLLILKFKWDPFLALIAVAIATGLAVGIPYTELPGTITGGFGSTLTGVGIMIGLGVMFGELLAASGAIERIAASLLKAFGIKRSPLAIAVTGTAVSIPVFFDAAFVILINLIRKLSEKTKISMVTFVTALAVGLIVTHSLVPPTPGPLVVADNTKSPLGWFIFYSLLTAIPAVLVGGWWYGLRAGKNSPAYTPEDGGEDHNATHQQVAAAASDRAEIGTGLSYFLLLLPIILILANTIVSLIVPSTVTADLFGFIGEKNVALFISVLVAAFILRPYLRDSQKNLFAKAIASAGLIILITGAGGAFGGVIKASGIGDYLVEVMQTWNMPVILLGFIFSQILRASLGSTTVALVTTSSILGPMVADLGVSPILLGLAICAGGVGLSLPNDSGFWVVNKFAKLSVPDTLKTWTVGGSLAGLAALGAIYVLSLFQGVLPGL
ncbi:GntP family permease [Paenibacillus alkalitolerans]|uniref:GntP family permease n=1 Tax=Paenibacillus alkalitolerans TaxID=2799335 RepID=UPI0018F583AF|nr:gluconate:H+ symporter [Paenibacillus alkalitolerans]